MRGAWKLDGKLIATNFELTHKRVLAPFVLVAVDRDGKQQIAVALDGDKRVVRWVYAPITTLELRALVYGGTSIRDAILKDRIIIVDRRSTDNAQEQAWYASSADIPADVLPGNDFLLPLILTEESRGSVLSSVGSETEIQIDGAAVLDGALISFEDLSELVGRIQKLWHAIAGTWYENNKAPEQKPAGQGFTASTLLLTGTRQGSFVAQVKPADDVMFGILLSQFKRLVETSDDDNKLDAELRACGPEVSVAFDAFMMFANNRKLEVLTKSARAASYVSSRKAARFARYFDERRAPEKLKPRKKDLVIGSPFRMEGYFLGYMHLAKRFEFFGRDGVTYDGEVFDSAMFPVEHDLPLGSAHVFEADFCPVSKGDKTTYRLLTFSELKPSDPSKNPSSESDKGRSTEAESSASLPDVEQEFKRLAAEWIKDTMLTSSLTKIVQHPAYQAIIGMGKVVVPFIIRDLETQPKFWGPALHAITGARPVPKEDAGKNSKVAAAWIQWAKDNGYKW